MVHPDGAGNACRSKQRFVDRDTKARALPSTRPGLRLWTPQIALAAFLTLGLTGNAYAQPTYNRVPLPPPGVQMPQGSPQWAVQNETVKSDQAWEAEDANGACSRLHDLRSDLPADIAACNRHQAAQPRCLDYKGFAKVWFDMRETHDDAFQYQPQMLISLGTGVGDRNVAIYHSPEYKAELRRLLSTVQTMDQSKWRSGASFAAVAYDRCMTGNLF
jgi:hypothetical protein